MPTHIPVPKDWPKTRVVQVAIFSMIFIICFSWLLSLVVVLCAKESCMNATLWAGSYWYLLVITGSCSGLCVLPFLAPSWSLSNSPVDVELDEVPIMLQVFCVVVSWLHEPHSAGLHASLWEAGHWVMKRPVTISWGSLWVYEVSPKNNCSGGEKLFCWRCVLKYPRVTLSSKQKSKCLLCL